MCKKLAQEIFLRITNLGRSRRCGELLLPISFWGPSWTGGSWPDWAQPLVRTARRAVVWRARGAFGRSLSLLFASSSASTGCCFWGASCWCGHPGSRRSWMPRSKCGIGVLGSPSGLSTRGHRHPWPSLSFALSFWCLAFGALLLRLQFELGAVGPPWYGGLLWRCWCFLLLILPLPPLVWRGHPGWCGSWRHSQSACHRSGAWSASFPSPSVLAFFFLELGHQNFGSVHGSLEHLAGICCLYYSSALPFRLGVPGHVSSSICFMLRAPPAETRQSALSPCFGIPLRDSACSRAIEDLIDF